MMQHGPEFIPHKHRETHDAIERPRWVVETWNAGTLATIAAVRRLIEITRMGLDALDEPLCNELAATSYGLASAWFRLPKPWEVAPFGCFPQNALVLDPDGPVSAYGRAFGHLKVTCDGARWLGTVPLIYAAMTPDELLAERLEFGQHWKNPRSNATRRSCVVLDSGAGFIRTAEARLLGPHSKFWVG
jgi:hypothetical protein